METNFINYVAASITISLLGISYYKGFFSKTKNWINVRQQRVKMLLTLAKNIQQSADSKKTIASFAVNESDLSASIIYERMGSQYILMVPYSRKYVAAMTQFKVELLRHDKEPLNITQQPGIPYIVTAHDLGGYSIRVTNEDTGISHEYKDTTPPMYGEEVMDQE